MVEPKWLHRLVEFDGDLSEVLSQNCLVFAMVLVYFLFLVHISLNPLCVQLRSVRGGAIVMENFTEVLDLLPQHCIQPNAVEDFLDIRFAEPKSLAATRKGADRRRHCIAEFGGDCQSHFAHSPYSHLRSTSDQILDVHTPQVMEEIIGASRGKVDGSGELR